MGAFALAHEFGHNLGFPDMYEMRPLINPVGAWCIMSNINSETPNAPLPSMSAYIKYRYTNWMGAKGTENIPLICLHTYEFEYTIRPLMSNSNDGFVALRFISPFEKYANGEYFIIENRSSVPNSIVDGALHARGCLYTVSMKVFEVINMVL